MALPWNGRPKFFRFVPRPASASNSELARAQNIYIHNLPEGGATTIADIAGLQTILDDIQTALGDHDTRIDALETAG